MGASLLRTTSKDGKFYSLFFDCGCLVQATLEGYTTYPRWHYSIVCTACMSEYKIAGVGRQDVLSHCLSELRKKQGPVKLTKWIGADQALVISLRPQDVKKIEEINQVADLPELEADEVIRYGLIELD